MTMKRFRWLALPALAFVSALAFAETAGFEQRDAGFVFVAGKAATAPVRENPASDAKVISQQPFGIRLVYRSYMDESGKRTWYKVEVPGGAPGWIAVSDISPTRPNRVGAAQPIKLIDSGSSAHTSGGITAAARGLDKRARSYGESQDLKVSVDQFVTIESVVNGGYHDEQDKDGVYKSEDLSVYRQNAAKRFHDDGAAMEVQK
jgi:hypothetical protein